MSYILDALNRADAERERGSVPGLHARQTYVQPSKSSNAHRRLWIALVATLTVASIASGVWLWRTPVATTPPAVAEPAVVAAAPAPTAPPAPPPPAAPTPTTPVAAPPVKTPVAKPAKQPVAPTKAPKATHNKPTPIEKEVVTVNTAVNIPLLSELSSSVRSQIPPLNITGSVYSKNPGQRLLLINNQVLNQGHLAAPEVTLEEIRPNSSVFSFRGTKFRMAH